jgi:hypothetical protein
MEPQYLRNPLMSVIGHLPARVIAKLLLMSEPIRIVTVSGNRKDGLFVTFSDGSTAGYLVDELFEPMSCREDGEGLKGPFSVFHSTVQLARPKKRT